MFEIGTVEFFRVERWKIGTLHFGMPVTRCVPSRDGPLAERTLSLSQGFQSHRELKFANGELFFAMTKGPTPRLRVLVSEISGRENSKLSACVSKELQAELQLDKAKGLVIVRAEPAINIDADTTTDDLVGKGCDFLRSLFGTATLQFDCR